MNSPHSKLVFLFREFRFALDGAAVAKTKVNLLYLRLQFYNTVSSRASTVDNSATMFLQLHLSNAPIQPVPCSSRSTLMLLC